VRLIKILKLSLIVACVKLDLPEKNITVDTWSNWLILETMSSKNGHTLSRNGTDNTFMLYNVNEN